MIHTPTLIYGSSGAAKDAYYWIKAMNRKNNIQLDVIGFIENCEDKIGNIAFDNQRIVTCDKKMKDYIKQYEKVALVIPFGQPKVREKIYLSIDKDCKNIYFPNIIHPSSIIDLELGSMGFGNIIGPGTIIASEFRLGNFNYISIGTVLGHDLKVDNFVSINPAVTIAGNVKIKDYCYIGMSSAINQEITIEENVIIGSGAVIISNITANKTVVGVPGKVIKDNNAMKK